MMIAVAGSGEHRPLYQESSKPLPTWAWAAIGASALVHAAGAVWLYHQTFEAPVVPTFPEPEVTTVTMEPLPRLPEEPVVADQAPPAPPLPIHDPVVVADAPIETSPFPVPDTPVAPGTVVGPVSLDPLPGIEGGTSVEPTPPEGPPVIRNPRWVRQPTAAQMERAYPRAAALEGLGGRAVISCVLEASGSVTGCSVVSETPEGEGFGRAALGLSRHFRLSQRTVDGRPVEGARVTIPLTFTLD